MGERGITRRELESIVAKFADMRRAAVHCCVTPSADAVIGFIFFFAGWLLPPTPLSLEAFARIFHWG